MKILVARTFLAIFSVVSFAEFGFSQAIYLPETHEVYPFLKRMEARELLFSYRDAALPLSRRDIAKHLIALDSTRDKMTRFERSELEFLREEFQYEIGSIEGDPEPSEIRWHLLSQPINEGILNLDLNYALRQRHFSDVSSSFRGQGLKLYGYAFKDVGFYFNWVDYRERGSGLNKTKENTPEPGVVLAKDIGDVIEYNNIDAQFTFHIGSFDFSLEKTKNLWGYGENGRVIFSDKAPSYPQIKMRVPISDKIDFVYLHAELNSNVLDSVRSYYTYSSSLQNYYRPVNRLKFIAAHQLEFTIWQGVDFSIGESVVYSDRGPLLLYLIPVMFFKAGEHYNKDTDNTQVFGSLDLNVIKDLNLYFSLFIDEINTDDFFDPDKSRKQVGLTMGLRSYDFLFNNSEFIAEYSRLNPWVYSHRFTAANFTNNGYTLGHWVGQNGDDLYFDFSYFPDRDLKIGGFAEVYRKGGLMDVSFQYQLPTPNFLYGPLHEERSIGFYARYQPLRDLFVDVRGRSLTIQDESNPATNRNKQFEFVIGASLGVW